MVFMDMLGEHTNIKIYLQHQQWNVNTVFSNTVDKTSIQKITAFDLEQNEFTGKVYIGATYEGDFMADAGVQNKIG